MTTTQDGNREGSKRRTTDAAAPERVLRRERFERQAARRVEAEGSPTRALAHDLGNALCVISGYADILLLQAEVSRGQREALLRIKQASDRASALARHLRALRETEAPDRPRAPPAHS